MSKTATRDPGVTKLLDELPDGNPDNEEFALVWTDYTPNKVEVPIRTDVWIDLGAWQGPAICLHKIQVKVLIRDKIFVMSQDEHQPVIPGDVLTLLVHINPLI